MLRATLQDGCAEGRCRAERLLATALQHWIASHKRCLQGYHRTQRRQRGRLKLTPPTATASPAVQFNTVYPTPCPTVPSFNIVTASDKRYSLGITTKHNRARR